jgi:hypothetical protein
VDRRAKRRNEFIAKEVYKIAKLNEEEERELVEDGVLDFSDFSNRPILRLSVDEYEQLKEDNNSLDADYIVYGYNSEVKEMTIRMIRKGKDTREFLLEDMKMKPAFERTKTTKGRQKERFEKPEMDNNDEKLDYILEVDDLAELLGLSSKQARKFFDNHREIKLGGEVRTTGGLIAQYVLKSKVRFKPEEKVRIFNKLGLEGTLEEMGAQIAAYKPQNPFKEVHGNGCYREIIKGLKKIELASHIPNNLYGYLEGSSKEECCAILDTFLLSIELAQEYNHVVDSIKAFEVNKKKKEIRRKYGLAEEVCDEVYDLSLDCTKEFIDKGSYLILKQFGIEIKKVRNSIQEAT